MPQGYLVPLPPRLTDNNNVLAEGYKIFTWTATGTYSVPLTTYSDSGLSSANTNPIIVGPSGDYRAFVGEGVELDISIQNASGVPQETFPSIQPMPDIDGFSASTGYNRAGATDSNGTYSNATVSSLTNSDIKVLAADATANSGSTGATLTSLTGFSWTLTSGGIYAFRVRGKVGMTTNGGLALAFKYTTLTLTSIVVNAIQRTASAFALAQSTTTADQTKFINQKAVVYLDVELEGSLVVNAGGTLALQFAQETSHADTTTVYKGFVGEFVRTS